jgi:GTP cyclohydrolase IB
MHDIIEKTLQRPDVTTKHQPKVAAALDWAGMSQIPMPFSVQDSTLGTLNCQGHAQAYVNIDRPEAKGIHMSRLHILLHDYTASQSISPVSLVTVLHAMLGTHQNISHHAHVAFNAQLYVTQPSLKSANQGWKAYPFTISATQRDQQPAIELQLSIPYASTCPCSASLARQLIEQAMQQDFKDQIVLSKEQLSRWLLSERSTTATAHGQRSFAHLKLKLAQTPALPIKSVINCVETALQTPVQAVVKREDEQEFARLNGQHLMFCEDAARYIQQALSTQANVMDFWIKVEHQESLHAHNAIAMATKGVPSGYVAQP